jgi:hypothetical protein
LCTFLAPAFYNHGCFSNFFDLHVWTVIGGVNGVGFGRYILLLYNAITGKKYLKESKNEDIKFLQR